MTHLLEQTRKNWHIVSALALGLIAWGANSAFLAVAQERTQKNAEDIQTIENEVDAVKESISDIKQSLASIDTTQQTSASEISRLRDAMERLVIELSRER